MARVAVDDTQKKYIETSKIIQHYMLDRDAKDSYLASKLGLNVRTFQRKKKNPELFRYPEVVKICNLLQVRAEDKEKML